MTKQSKKEKGQALPMVTLSLVAMCGMMGLAVDLGWSFFVKRSAQTAADAAAQAAVQQVLDSVGQSGAILCSNTQIACQAVAPCNASANLTTGCLYAQQHGFEAGVHSGRDNLSVGACTAAPARPATGEHVEYWVTVRATVSIPR